MTTSAVERAPKIHGWVLMHDRYIFRESDTNRNVSYDLDEVVVHLTRSEAVRARARIFVRERREFRALYGSYDRHDYRVVALAEPLECR